MDRSIVAKLRMAGLAILTSAVLMGAAVPRAQASGMTDATMFCGLGLASASFSLPVDGSARYSQFFYRLDGGPWQTTEWYYTAGQSAYMYDTNQSRWTVLPADGRLRVLLVGNRRHVEGWELRYVNDVGRWFNLGSCTTSSFFEPYIIYTYH